MGAQQKEGRWLLTEELEGPFIGELTFELDFEECFGGGQCRQRGSEVEL